MRETNVVDPERMQSLISYSRKLEGDMFDNASSKVILEKLEGGVD